MARYDSIILGAGPAGLTAGLYLARGRQKVAILDTGMGGGQVNLTHAVANFPGTGGEVFGYKLAGDMKKQALEFGCEIFTNRKILEMDLRSTEKSVKTSKGDFSAPSVIIATGGKPRTLGIESELNFQGQGVSYCATCDGDFFTGEDILVVGGGNSALEEAVSLTQYAKSVTIVHQFDHFQGSPHAIKAAEENKKINIMMESQVEGFVGDQTLSAVDILDKKTGTVRRLAVTGAFVLIGYIPNSEDFAGIVDRNPRGEILSDEDMASNVPGVFVAGDVRAKKYRQITTAVSDGTVAALNVMEYLYGVDPDKD